MISNLREVPQFADTVAHRGWHAWWTTSGIPLPDYRAHLNPMLEGDGIPLCRVAHAGETYLCAESRLRSFSIAKQWMLMEADVSGLDVFVSDCIHC